MMKKYTLAFAIAGTLATSAASASTVGAGGQLVIDFDRTVTDNFVTPLTYNKFYSAADVEGRTQQELIDSAGSGVASGNFTLDVYGSTAPSNAQDTSFRNPQATNFEFTNPNPDAGTGEIGLGGAMIYSNAFGTATAGDFDLTPSGSDWLLTSNMGGLSTEIFLLTGVTTNTDVDSFTLSGNLEFASDTVAAFLGGTTGVGLGSFAFSSIDPAIAAADIAFAEAAGAGNNGGVNGATSVSAVPVPAAVWLFGTGLVGLMGMNRNKQRVAA